MELSRHLGLRTEETMQSVKSLMTWQKVLQSDQEKVRIVFGTKGGRPRDTTIIDRQTLLSVVNNAIRFMKNNNGKLIDKAGIHLAIERYRNIVREAGLVGKYAPHSLRYAYKRCHEIPFRQGIQPERSRGISVNGFGPWRWSGTLRDSCL